MSASLARAIEISEWLLMNFHKTFSSSAHSLEVQKYLQSFNYRSCFKML